MPPGEEGETEVKKEEDAGQEVKKETAVATNEEKENMLPYSTDELKVKAN